MVANDDKMENSPLSEEYKLVQARWNSCNCFLIMTSACDGDLKLLQRHNEHLLHQLVYWVTHKRTNILNVKQLLPTNDRYKQKCDGHVSQNCISGSTAEQNASFKMLTPIMTVWQRSKKVARTTCVNRVYVCMGFCLIQIKTDWLIEISIGYKPMETGKSHFITATLFCQKQIAFSISITDCQHL